MMRTLRMPAAVIVVCLAAAAGSAPAQAAEPDNTRQIGIIPCHGMIDDGLYQSIRRRANMAIEAGADYLVLDIGTYGGLVQSADDISKFLIHDISPKAHTIAYVSTEAISAGAMISVACKDIVMKANTTIGCSAPITPGQELEGTEREKAESFIRATFSRAAQANGYPEPLLKAMVSVPIEVWQIRNKKTGQWEFFEGDRLPADPNGSYDMDGKKLINSKEELLTLTDQKAKEYGLARAVVNDLDEMASFIAQRDGVVFERPFLRLETNWSEELVRWLNSPVIMGILFMGLMLGFYVEINTPGLGAAGLTALVCLALIVGSKYLVGMANWVEIVILLAGVLMLLLEIFVIPGFGFVGVFGIVFIAAGLFGMLIRNAPDELPWPRGPQGWDLFIQGASGMILGIIGTVLAGMAITRYLPESRLFRGLVLKPAGGIIEEPISSTTPAAAVGSQGQTLTDLRPAGTARFGDKVLDVVSRGEYIAKGCGIEIIEVLGNRIVVKNKG